MRRRNDADECSSGPHTGRSWVRAPHLCVPGCRDVAGRLVFTKHGRESEAEPSMGGQETVVVGWPRALMDRKCFRMNPPKRERTERLSVFVPSDSSRSMSFAIKRECRAAALRELLRRGLALVEAGRSLTAEPRPPGLDGRGPRRPGVWSEEPRERPRPTKSADCPFVPLAPVVARRKANFRKGIVPVRLCARREFY